MTKTNEDSEESNYKDVDTGKTKKIALVIVISIVVLFAFLTIGNTVQVPYTAKVMEVMKEPYTEPVCKDVQVPYDDKECHWEKEPYTDNVCNDRQYSYTVLNWNGVVKEWSNFNYICYGRFDARNNENRVGSFSFSFVFHSGTNGDQPRSAVSKSIDALGTQRWTFSYDCDAGESVSGNYNAVSIPTVRECHTETKYTDKNVCENVIKYRTEQQCEDVTKYRDKQVEKEVTRYHSLFEAWGWK